MRVNPNAVKSYTQPGLKNQLKTEEKKVKEKSVPTKQDQYIPGKEKENKINYERPKIDRAAIKKLKAESRKR